MPELRRYLVEWYRPGLTGEILEQVARRIGRVTGELSVDGIVVEMLLTIGVPADDVAFGLFAAHAPDSVARACRHAGVPAGRIAEAIGGVPWSATGI